MILIDEAPETLRQAIMETGRVLLDRDPEAWKELRVRTMREPSGRSAKAIESLKRVGKLSR
jgi:hypothetical protein